MKRKIIGYLSIIVGLVADVKLFFDMFFMDYFASAGRNSMLGLFIIYFILIAGGISLLFKWKNYYILYYIYFLSLVIERTIVYLREILESPQFVENKSNLTLPLGRDVSGNAMVTPLDKMPHLLIAGATGSGKSVCMNTFLTALLFQNAPDQLKLILIDPKRVELMPYDGIPHLLTPVITESEKALQALRWAVAEMGRRLHRLSEAGARNIDEYNEKQTEEENVLPRIVIVVDELADLMMRQFRRDTETMVARIAQMSRAVGMHLIIATQRPSVDVITGLIKANIPTRIGFRTVSAVDSRTVLDSIGAEDLLGKGDMLLMTAEVANPQRIQGIFVSTKEVERVINAVKIAGGGKITEEIPMNNEEADENGIVSASSTMINLEADDDGGKSKAAASNGSREVPDNIREWSAHMADLKRSPMMSMQLQLPTPQQRSLVPVCHQLQIIINIIV